MTPDVSKDHLPIHVASALDDAGLSVHAFRVLARICRRWSEKDGCFESGGSIAAACRMKRDTAFRALAELEERGMIRRDSRTGQTSRIDVLPVSEWTINQPPPVPRNGAGTRPPKRDRLTADPSPETGHPPSRMGGHPPVPFGGTLRDTRKGTQEGRGSAHAQVGGMEPGTPASAYVAAFAAIGADFRPNLHQLVLLNACTDAAAFEAALAVWLGNDHKPASVARFVDRYRRIAAGESGADGRLAPTGPALPDLGGALTPAERDRVLGARPDLGPADFYRVGTGRDGQPEYRLHPDKRAAAAGTRPAAALPVPA